MSKESAESLPESSTATAATADNNSRSGDPSQSSDGPLTPFYEQLLKVSFPDSVTAIEHCRDLCAQFGFTVKQEASTHRNIYVYCSREGLPDSLRNPKANPKRKRPSKRCDCRWRVVLYEQNGHWEFRKSLNPDAAKHNHELMRPEDIDRNWPKKVIDLIYELARTNLATADIRAKVQAEFPDISWNERRFYNRLSEERQKIRHREAAVRARRLTNVWGQVCMAAAGNEELSDYVETEITKLLYATCQMAKLDPQTLRQPMFASELEPPAEQNQTALTASSSSSIPPHVSSPLQSQSGSGDLASSTLPPPPKRKGSQSKQKAPAQSSTASPVSKPPDPPKGFTTVVIPEHTYFVKIHSQRIANEIQLIRNPRRSRSMSTSEEAPSSDISFPARKLQKRARTSQQLQPPSELRIAHSPVDPSVQPQEQQRPPMLEQQHTNFVYHTGYDEQGIPMQSAIPGYDFHRFHQPYSISPTGSTGFAPPPQAPADMPPLQHFDPSNQIVRTTNEPTIHPALQSNPVAHRPPIRRDSAHNMYPLGSAPGVYQLAAAAAVVTSREEEMRQDNRDRNLYMHQQHEQHHQILPPYQAEHPPDTPMPGREHKSEPQ